MPPLLLKPPLLLPLLLLLLLLPLTKDGVQCCQSLARLQHQRHVTTCLEPSLKS
jgi:hypothetical protein